MTNDPWPDLTVTKLDAAARQFETAIALWFTGGDAVSMHMLAAGAHRIVHDMGKKQGLKSPIMFNDAGWTAAGYNFEDFKKYVMAIENFSKHAERDAGKTLTFKPNLSAFYLADGLDLFHGLGGPLSDTMRAFKYRMALEFPGLYPNSPAQLIDEAMTDQLRRLPKQEFLALVLEQFARVRAETGS